MFTGIIHRFFFGERVPVAFCGTIYERLCVTAVYRVKPFIPITIKTMGAIRYGETTRWQESENNSNHNEKYLYKINIYRSCSLARILISGFT